MHEILRSLDGKFMIILYPHAHNISQISSPSIVYENETIEPILPVIVTVFF